MPDPDSSPYTTAQIMLMLKAMSRDVAVEFSEYTDQWYVSAKHLEIGDGVLLKGGSEHRDTPDQAVQAFFNRLTNIDMGEYVVGDYWGQRREYRWNGAAFAEVTRPEVLARQASENEHSRAQDNPMEEDQ